MASRTSPCIFIRRRYLEIDRYHRLRNNTARVRGPRDSSSNAHASTRDFSPQRRSQRRRRRAFLCLVWKAGVVDFVHVSWARSSLPGSLFPRHVRDRECRPWTLKRNASSNRNRHQLLSCTRPHSPGTRPNSMHLIPRYIRRVREACSGEYRGNAAIGEQIAMDCVVSHWRPRKRRERVALWD